MSWYASTRELKASTSPACAARIHRCSLRMTRGSATDRSSLLDVVGGLLHPLKALLAEDHRELQRLSTRGYTDLEGRERDRRAQDVLREVDRVLNGHRVEDHGRLEVRKCLLGGRAIQAKGDELVDQPRVVAEVEPRERQLDAAPVRAEVLRLAHDLGAHARTG